MWLHAQLAVALNEAEWAGAGAAYPMDFYSNEGGGRWTVNFGAAAARKARREQRAAVGAHPAAATADNGTGAEGARTRPHTKIRMEPR